ncbi:MAG TPA: SGNH/GDSL hydrolase family protein [Mycobacteriales bacterium]
MIRAKSALAAAGALMLAGALAAGVAHAAGPADRPAAAHPAPTSWVGSWGSVPTTVPPASDTVFSDQTIRQTVHLSVGGSRLRVRFSNEFGTAPLVIGEAHVGRAAGSEPSRSVAAGSDRRLTFAGQVSATVPAGAPLLSDPVRLAVPAGADLVVSLYLPQPTKATTTHAFAFQDNVVAAGNVTGSRTVTPTATFQQWWFLSGVSVAAPARDGAVVALGDSITDGANTTPNRNARWPDVLARRLQATPDLRGLGVLNEGISGNRLLHDPNPLAGSGADAFAAQFGESALRRFDRDVSSQPGGRYVIVLLGVNDLGHPGTIAPESERVTPADLIAGYQQVIARAHQQGMLVFGGTITPFANDTFGFDTPANRAARLVVNHWIRTSGAYDGVIDFDAALRDPADPERIRPEFDSGDHLHPNDAGAAALANAVPLRLFR